jgi:predicted RecB family nuclease
VRQTPKGLSLSATDLSNSLACRHLTGLDMSVALEGHRRPFRNDPLGDILRDRGLAHEKAYVDHLKAQGRGVLDLSAIKDPQAAATATIDAMGAGQGVIVQGALLSLDDDGRWYGRPDVLLRTDKPGKWPWSYEAVDTKLAQETHGGAILQLSFYSELLRLAQGTSAEYFHVVTPKSGYAGEIYRTADYAAYFRTVRARLEATTAQTAAEVIANSYPEPIDHCDVCAWYKQCDTRRRKDDHLSLVANASRSQRRELETHGLATLGTLARCGGITFKPKHGSREALEKVRDQARVQFESRGREIPLHELKPFIKDEGLELLPEPTPGDVFLDLEGDPFAAEGGREYLFGIITLDAASKPVYREWWGLSEAEEKQAFEAVMDSIDEQRAKHPTMHVYHYGHYEPTNFKKLMGRHATRVEKVDELLRGGHFIDLLEVVRQGLIAGVESYSIKKLEPLYVFVREVPLEDARSGLRQMERGLETGIADMPAEVRSVVAGYNRDDCVSTLRLRDWLEGLRAAAIDGGADLPRPGLEESKPSKAVSERVKRVEARRAQLLVGVPKEKADRNEEQRARWLLAYMLDWHSREGKAAAWEYFRLKDMPVEDLHEERQALAGLKFVEEVPAEPTARRSSAVIHRYRYPEQEMEVRAKDELKTRDGKQFGVVVAVGRRGRTIDVKKSGKHAHSHPENLFAHTHRNPSAMENAIDRLAQAVIADGCVDPASAKQNPVAASLLLGRAPKLRSGAFEPLANETAVQFAVRAVRDMEGGVLAIQGPPGAGKTFTGATIIRDLVKRKKKVGVMATSHKVILNLLKAVLDLNPNEPIAVAHKGDEDQMDGSHPNITPLARNEAARDALRDGTANVVGGTAWMWAREDFANTIDVLFIDEAAQMSLANALAASHAATRVVLLGDPQQLEQPKKGSHPEGVDASALGHMLGDHPTIPKERGIFLPVTWRLAPSVAGFTSELFYDGLLASKPGLENQILSGTSDLDGSGLRLLEVSHDGNRNSSEEEIDAIAALVARLAGGPVEWIDEEGKATRVTGADILVVAPYNAQVTRLAERLASTGVQVGTVDKFQGQEAAIVIYSMATSRPEDAPRGMEFLYSMNRLNVATSRARCVAILVASPRLFEPECKTPRQMKLANALCRFRELAGRIPPQG